MAKAPAQNALPNMSDGDAFAFFNSLSQAEAKPPVQETPASQQEQSPALEPARRGPLTSTVQETVSRNSNWDESTEAIIKQNLLLGQLEYAAQVALKAGRSTEAFLIAEAGGEDLFEQIKAEYFAQHKDPFVSEIIAAVAQQDFSDVLEQVRTIEQHPGQALRQLGHCTWKEAIAYALAYHDEQRLKEVAKTLGDQLLKNKTDINSAIVCYILANELDIVTDLWKKRALYHIRKLGVNKNEALFMLYQKTFLLATAFRQSPNDDMDLILADLAEFLHAEQMSALALKVLGAATNERPEVRDLHFRIHQSLNPQEAAAFQPRPYPYEQVTIRAQQAPQRVRSVPAPSHPQNQQ